MNVTVVGRLLVALVIALAVAPAAHAATAVVTFRTSDGVLIAGTVYAPSRRPAPYVILVHMLTRSRDDWQALATRLADAGIGVLAIDLRGHGASGPDPRPDANPDDLSADLHDVQAARAFLAGRADLGVTTVGIGGAQIGANLAVMAASGDPTIRSIVLLSPGLDFRSLRSEAPMYKYGGRPALMVASQEDSYPTRSIRRLAKDGSGTREVRIVSGAGHGTVMLTRQPDLIALIVEWFQRTL
jgi:alpha-beta hydrolase superfamily lysophospholipase